MSSGNGGEPPLLLSVVSHGHGRQVVDLLRDLAQPGNAGSLRVLLTLNVPEDERGFAGPWPFPFEIIRNRRPKGFSANHNAAFRHPWGMPPCRAFAVLNPDLRVPAGSLDALLRCLDEPPGAQLVAPAVLAPDGRIEDSARRLPTPALLLRKGLARLRAAGPATVDPDWLWLAGMLLVFDAAAFRAVGGFDEGYRLYYEDVDICCRLRLAGARLRYCPEIGVVHDARRDSHRRLGYLLRHARSVLRFFLSPTYRRCRRLGGGDLHG